MASAKVRLALAATAFVAWLGWLAYLVFESRDQVILSRPQFLVANVHTIATLAGDAQKPDRKAKIIEVRWTSSDGDKKVAGSEVAITNLDEIGPAQGWEGPGDYIVALTRTKDGYRLTPIPPSPGYPGNFGRIYKATKEATDQLADMPRPQ